MTAIVIRCLGAFEVTLASQAVTAFPTDKIRALLAYLALTEAQPHRRELLAGLFWPELPQAVAMTNVRVALYRLRETLEKVQPGADDALLLTTRQTLQLNTAHLWVDVHTFQKLLATCATHAHANLIQCDECKTRFVEAVVLYRAELLAGLGLADAPDFEEWLLLQRETLHQQALGTLHTLVQMHEQRGDEQQAAHYAQRQLALDPSREEAHRQLMRSLARRGLHSEAFAQFERCRHLLWEHLGVEPDLETLALVEQIRAGQLKETRGQGDKETRRQGDLVNEPLLVSPSPLLPPTPGLGWNEAPQTTKLYGRKSELSEVAAWLVQTTGAPAARLVAILGMGGIGKTTLAAATANAVAHQFEVVVWRSLLNAPPLEEVLQGWLQRLPAQQPMALPSTLNDQLALLLDCLRQRRCLLVLDNMESILQTDGSGAMRPGYAGYAQLLQWVVEQKHQSCLLLTSRERPQGLARWAEDTPLVRTLTLEGLDSTAATAMLNARGLTGQRADASALVARYSGNPLALKLVAQTVQELFAGDIAAFLTVEMPIFDDIRTVLDQQFARLTPLEQELLLWLAVERVPVTAVALRANLVQPPPMSRFLEALRTLQRRSLLESTSAGFTLQNVVIEYLTERLIEGVCAEIAVDKETRRQGEGETRGQGDNQTEGANFSLSPSLPLSLSYLNRHALLKAQAPESIRQSQVRLILQPVAQRLLTQVGKTGLATQIAGLLTGLRRSAPLTPGYAGGNLLNLLLTLEMDVRGYDFSHLCVWQAYLRDAYLPGLQLIGADLTGAAFTQRVGAVQGLHFGNDDELRVVAFREGLLGLWRARTGELIQRVSMDAHTLHSVSLSNDGRLMAQLTNQQTIHLVDVTSDRLLHTLTSDHGPIWRISFSPNGQYVASGHVTGYIGIWEVASGRLCAEWQAHGAAVTALAFAPDNLHLASGSVDHSAALWQATTATLLHTVVGHTDEVATLAFTPDGATLMTGSHDFSVRLWVTASGALLAVLHGHTHLVRQVVIAPNGRWAATGGGDRFLYLWDLASGKAHLMLADHDAALERIAFSADGQSVAAYDLNGTISLWAVASGQRLDSYRLHHAAIHALAFSPDGHQLASGGADQAVYLWDVHPSGQAQVAARLAGHRRRVYTLAFSPTGDHLASGDFGGDLRLWHSASGGSRSLPGCQGEIREVAFSPDGQTLANTSQDGLRLWSVATGRQTHLLTSQTQAADACTFSPDGRWLATSHLDHTIYLWDRVAPTGIRLRHTLRHHTNLVRMLLFSPDSRTLFSASFDHTLCRWDVQTGKLQASWSTQRAVYITLAIQPDGQRLASGGDDHIIRLLDSESGAIHTEWHGHTHVVEALSFRADGQLLASASWDETIRLWEVSSGTCLQVLRAPGPYAGMNISGVTGISDAQKAALKALGAVEEDKETRWQGDKVAR